MKLLELTLENFLGHRKLTVDLDNRLTLISGKNGSGKSSCRDAIVFALLGRCRSTDRGGRGAASAIRQGASTAAVGLLIQQEPAGRFHIARTIQKTGTQLSVGTARGVLTGKAAQKCLDEILWNLPADLVEAVLDMPALLSLPAAARSACLARALDVRLSRTEIRDLMAEEGVGADPQESILLGIKRFEPPGTAPLDADYWITTEILAEVYQAAYTKRTEVNAEIRRLQAGAEAGRPGDMVVSPDTLERVRGGLEAAEREVAEVRRQVDAARLAANTHGNLARVLAAQQDPAAPAPVPPDLDPDVMPRLEKNRAKAQEIRTALDDVRRERNDTEKELRRLADRSAVCPSVCAPRVCPYLEADMATAPDRVETLRAEIETLVAADRDLTGQAVDVREMVEQDENLVAIHQREVQRTAGAAAATVTNRAEIEQQMAEFAWALESLPRLEAALAQKTAALDTNRAGVATLESQARAITEYQAAIAAIREGEESARVLDEAVRALGPKGLPAAAARRVADPLIRRTNALLEQMRLAREYRVGVAHGKDGLDLSVAVTGGEPMTPENLSTSEHMRVGLALGAALSGLTGLDILVVDDFEVLRGDAREDAAAAVYDLSQDLDSVVVLETAEAPPEQEPDPSIHRVWLDHV